MRKFDSDGFIRYYKPKDIYYPPGTGSMEEGRFYIYKFYNPTVIYFCYLHKNKLETMNSDFNSEWRYHEKLWIKIIL
jgi:hypothetical protein